MPFRFGQVLRLKQAVEISSLQNRMIDEILNFLLMSIYRKNCLILENFLTTYKATKLYVSPRVKKLEYYVK